MSKIRKLSTENLTPQIILFVVLSAKNVELFVKEGRGVVLDLEFLSFSQILVLSGSVLETLQEPSGIA